MKNKTLAVLITAIFLLILTLTLFNAIAEEPPKTVNILFVGNSLTYSGNIAAQLQLLAGMYGVDIDYTRCVWGGVGLDYLIPSALEAMENNSYDYVVLQDFGGREGSIEFYDDVKTLCDAAKENGATPVIFSPAWMHIDGYPDKEAQDFSTSCYKEAAVNNDALFVPAGDAWVYAYMKLDDIKLYVKDDYHPNSAGSYYTACVFASILFDLQIKDIPHDLSYLMATGIYGRDVYERWAIELGCAAWEFSCYYKENDKSPEHVVSVPDKTTQLATSADPNGNSSDDFSVTGSDESAVTSSEPSETTSAASRTPETVTSSGLSAATEADKTASDNPGNTLLESSPNTGDNLNNIMVLISICAVGAVLMLLLAKRKQEHHR